MPARSRGCLTNLLKLALLGMIVAYGVIGVTSPWAFHIGGGWTPLLYWSGQGRLVTKSGAYPLYITLYPSEHFSRLHLDGLRPTGGVQGTGSLCTSRGVVQQLKLSGTIYNGWSSTKDALIEVRVLEFQYFNTGQQRGYFDLYGRWSGPALVMDDRGRYSSKFNSGMHIEHASVTFEPSGYSDFKAACASATAVSAPSG